MATIPGIRILERENNRIGDLFTRLVSDVFLSLGYDQDARFDVSRSGREIDVEVRHRLEARKAIAECKATQNPVGGDQVNKFAGGLDVESGRSTDRIQGYYLSIGGFTEAAKEQERARRDSRTLTRFDMILLDSDGIVNELVAGRVIVTEMKAAEKAGRCAAAIPDISLLDETELLAHDRGWIWAFYYGRGHERTHFVLIHADGEPLAASVARDIVAADQTVGGLLHELGCLNSDGFLPIDDGRHATQVLDRYRQYLLAECGEILLDGLPADTDTGTRRLQLEHLFVPLRARRISSAATKESGAAGLVSDESPIRISELLSQHPRLAILSPPGGGKSTLVKRLAVAYADPARRALIDDGLPDRTWLPVFLRCRELRDDARKPFSALVTTLAKRASLDDVSEVFKVCVSKALQEGEVLLLVDGLDEISDPGDRAAFVHGLRTLLAMYPGIHVAITSRPAGFRHVAALIANLCVQVTLADFDSADIRQLVSAWHRQVAGNRSSVSEEAVALADTIVSNDRIKQLAANPLLLMTLLLVKRWVGQLPTRRSALYGKAVEVLLMTWNVAGHSPLDPDEALPQLCFVAHSMMSRGEQRISRAELRRRLTTARNEMSNLLGFARVGVAELIELVEQRSGLLVDTGPDIFEGELIDSYEFRHLTFQEYLTAKALVEGWYEARQPQDNLITTLQAHFKDERWREVIPLAAAIGGRGAERLVWALTGECHPDNAYGRGSPNVQFVATALANCLADEAPVAQKGAEEAVYALIANAGGTWLTESIARRILNSKYGELFAAKARQSFLDCKPDFGNAASALAKSVPEADATLCRASRRLTASPTIHALIDGNDRAARCVGALSFTQIAKELGQETLRTYDSHHEVVAAFAKMISSADHAEQFAGCWAIGALHTDSLHESSKREELSNVLHVLARESPHSEVRAAAASACARFGAVRS